MVHGSEGGFEIGFVLGLLSEWCKVGDGQCQCVARSMA